MNATHEEGAPAPQTCRRKPIFLDRDGVLNVDISPYVTRVEELKLFPWTVEALTLLDRSGYDIYVVSNQQGVAKGMFTEQDLDQMTEAIQASIRPLGFQIRKFYYCTAMRLDGHPWRKPACGMIDAAREEFGLDTTGAFVVGDKWSDIEMAHRAGCRPILLLSGVTRKEEWQEWTYLPEQVFPNLLDAVRWILYEAQKPA